MTAEDFKREFGYKEILQKNYVLNGKLHETQMSLNHLRKNQENIINKAVKNKTKELKKDYENKLKEKDKEIKDKDAQILALKKEISKMASIMNNDSTNSGLPTSKTPLNKKKYIPNSREKSGKSIGGQQGHKKHKLNAFTDEEATEILEVKLDTCPHCNSKNIVVLNTSIDKCETDYDVKLIKRKYKFKNYKCLDCGKESHKKIPNELKEENQYGKTVQALSICLTNEIYTPFNKTRRLMSGITEGEINLSEGYIAKLQPRAYNLLDNFIKELEDYIPKQPVYGWDEGVIFVNQKQEVLRTYCTEKVALFYASDSKSKDSVDKDNILPKTLITTIVMHDHWILNYNKDYCFKNVECLAHLIRRLMKMYEKTKHEIYNDIKFLISGANKDRNNKISNGENSFSKEYITNLHKQYKDYINELKKINKNESFEQNYYKDEELSFLEDLLKYEENYLMWADHFIIPATNNNCERSIRPVKSKMKISGQFKNLEYAKYYATIRSYIETCKRNGINIIFACESLMSGRPLSLKEILEYRKNQDK